jgi:hypothetical protein
MDRQRPATPLLGRHHLAYRDLSARPDFFIRDPPTLKSVTI